MITDHLVEEHLREFHPEVYQELFQHNTSGPLDLLTVMRECDVAHYRSEALQVRLTRAIEQLNYMLPQLIDRLSYK